MNLDIGNMVNIVFSVLILAVWLSSAIVIYNSSRQKQKEDRTLSVPTSGDTKQDDAQPRFERRASLPVDNPSAEEAFNLTQTIKL
jgi:hypothetical protein